MNRITVTIDGSYKFWNSQCDALRVALVNMFGRNVDIKITLENDYQGDKEKPVTDN